MVRPAHPELVLVIPCFNEEAALPSLLDGLKQFIVSQSSVSARVLFVNDGSSDRTGELLDAACAQDNRFACLHFSRNFGHQTAVSAGLAHAHGDAVAVLDADLQDPPHVIAGMIEKWREGYDVVYGVRQNRKEGFVLRFAYATFYRALRWVANIDIPLDAGDFSLMDKKVVDEINRMPEHNRFVRGLRGWVGHKQIGLPYERQARSAGEAKYNLRRLTRLALDGIINFSSVPLRLASWGGAFASAIGFIMMLWAVASAFIFQRTPSGWASLAVMILFFCGIQLLVLGIMGEYVGRIFDEVKNRPHYIVGHKAGWLEKPGV